MYEKPCTEQVATWAEWDEAFCAAADAAHPSLNDAAANPPPLLFVTNVQPGGEAMVGRVLKVRYE